MHAQVLAWLVGDGRESSMPGSDAIFVPSYGNEDPAAGAVQGSANGSDEKRTRLFPRASRAQWRWLAILQQPQ